jgi:hypothetical protein
LLRSASDGHAPSATVPGGSAPGARPSRIPCTS